MASTLFPIQFLLFIAHFVKTGFCCIGFGGCSFLGYPAAAYRCGPAYYSAYYPAAGCYGAYCRNRLKGAPTLALNESTTEEGNEDENGGINGKAAMGEGGKRHSAQSTGAQDGNGRDGFGEMQVSPDALFFECCQSWSLPPQCLLKCSFANYSAETLRSMFLRSDECPIESASIIHFCASQNRDHRPCCLQAGIDQTKAGQKCLIFCDQMPQNETRLDLGYLPCFERFSEMKRCFYENALRTIDYLEAELEEIRRGQNVNANSPDVEDLDGETKEVGGGFTIGRPPIIFVNDISPKHPRINDDYFEEVGEDRDLIGKRRKRINKRN